MNMAADYVGLPFLDRGRDRAGLDCWGLVRLVFAEKRGITLPDFSEISAHDARRVAEAIAAECETDSWLSVMRGAEQEFDVVVMRGPIFAANGKAYGVARHMGVVTDDRRILHIEEGIDAVCIPLRSQSVKDRIMKVYRYHA